MTYEIVKGMPEVPHNKGGAGYCKSQERIAMEALEVGDGFYITDAARVGTAKATCFYLRPKVFTVRKVAGVGWQVRRTK